MDELLTSVKSKYYVSVPISQQYGETFTKLKHINKSRVHSSTKTTDVAKLLMLNKQQLTLPTMHCKFVMVSFMAHLATRCCENQSSGCFVILLK